MDELEFPFNFPLFENIDKREPSAMLTDKRYTKKYVFTLSSLENLKPRETSTTKAILSVTPNGSPYKLPPISQKCIARRRPLPTRITDILVSELNTFNAPMTSEFRTIKSVDPRFFSIADGRPIRAHEMIGEYKSNVDKVFLKRHGIMRYRDVMLIWDYNLAAENKRYDKVCVKLENNIQCYETFLSNDHKFSMRLINEQRKIFDQIEILNKGLNKINKKEASQRRKIMNFYNLIIRYLDIQAFMYHISPRHWRLEKNIDTISSKGGFVWIGDTGTRYVDVKVGDVSEVHDSIPLDELKQFVNGLKKKKPLMYFKTALDLPEYFDNMVETCSFSWNHSQILSDNVYAINVKLDEYKVNYISIVKGINSVIKDVTQDVMKWEMCYCLIQQRFSKVFNSITSLFLSVEVSNLSFYIENIYEVLVAKNDTNRDCVLLLRDVDIMYERLMLQLDFIDLKAVKALEKEVYTEDLKTQSKAVKDHKNLIETLYLTKNLTKAFTSPKKRNKIEMKPRKIISYKRKKTKRPKRELSDYDVQYLNFFTSWCQGEDPTKYLDELNDMKWLKELDYY